MTGAETIFIRGEGGNIWEMGLPLSPDHAKALAAGRLVQVANADGDPLAPVASSEPADLDEDDLDDTGDDAEDDTPPELADFLATPPEPITPPPAKPRTRKGA